MDCIANNSKDVHAIVCSEGIPSFLWEIKSYLFKCNQSGEIDEVSDHLLRFTPDYYPDQYDYRAADWLFVLNTMNFALWNPKDTKQWTVKELTGYQALCAAIKRAIDNGRPIWDPKYYTKLRRHDLEVIFKSDDEETSIPLIDERLEILHEVGKVLLKKFQGSFVRCIQLSDRKPIKLLQFIVNEFESYKDEPLYNNGKKVCLYIKAHILLSDIWFCFKRHELGLDYDINMMNSMISSMYIDYRVSQILCHFKILKYDTLLMNKLKNNELLIYGSSEEIEIRSCSISIIKSLAEEIERTYRDWKMEDISQRKINFYVLIINFLWDYRQAYDQLLMETQPFPLVQCVYY